MMVSFQVCIILMVCLIKQIQTVSDDADEDYDLLLLYLQYIKDDLYATAATTADWDHKNNKTVTTNELEARKLMNNFSRINHKKMKNIGGNDSQFVPILKQDIVDDKFSILIENYPNDHIRQVLTKDFGKYQEFFIENNIMPLTIAQRMDHSNEENMCSTVSRIIYPQAGRTQNGQFLFIVNQGLYRQGVRIELCLLPKKPCQMSENFPLGYTTKCKQIFTYHYLISLNAHGAAVRNVFKFPVCCQCFFEHADKY